jgi:putative selenium metabolism protein SsnA
MSTLLIGPGTVVTPGSILTNGGVLTEGGLIRRVDRFDLLRTQHPEACNIPARGGLIMPSLTNAHTHLYGLFARGFAFPGPAPRTFRQILEQVWWKLDRALTREAVHLSALYGLAEHLRCGVTALCDHHASPAFIPGSLDEIARAAETLGIRACLAYEVTDRNGPEGAANGIAENIRFIRSGRLPARFGLHASFTLSDATLAACTKAADELGPDFPGFHIHLAEGPEDPTDALNRYRCRTAQRLARAGILRPGTFVGHGVHLDGEEVSLLAETGVVLTHQPQSNMGNAVGFPRVLAMRERGVRTALGTDGYTADMLETVRAAATLHSHSTGAPSAGLAEFAAMLLHENPAILSEVFGVTLGRLEPGAAADLLVADYYPPTPLTQENFPFHLLFGLRSAHIATVVAAGKVVLDGHRTLGIDEADLAREAQRVAAEVWAQICHVC